MRKLHQPRARLLVGAGLVKPELPLLADADNHQIDVVDRPVVGFAVTRDARFGHRPVGNMDVFGQDIDMVEKLLVDAVVAALLFGRSDRVELVEAVNGDVPEADLPLLVAFDQLAVETQRRAARGEAQHEGLRLLVDLVRAVDFVVHADRLDDVVGDVLHTFVLVFVDLGVDLLVTMDDVARSRFGNQTAVFGE